MERVTGTIDEEGQMSETAPHAWVVELHSEAEQMALGARLAGVLRARSGVVHLQGDLGAGKTTLVRGLLRALGHSGPVRSPTYTLIESYDLDSGSIHHLDLYRLSDPEELEYLGLRDLLSTDALLFVEWPERGRGFLPEPNLLIRLEHLADGRRLTLRSERDWSDLKFG